MRLVHVSVPAGKRETVLETLDEEGIDYVVSDETSGRDVTAVVSFPLPTTAVEPVLDALREAGLAEDTFTVVLDARTVVSRHFEALEEEYGGTGAAEDRIAREEIRAEAGELLPSFTTYVALAVISAVVATAGLLLDSPAIVVGSMVIAPVLGPALATNVGTVIQDDDLFRTGLRLQLVGFAVAVFAATAFAFLVRVAFLVPPGLEVTTIEQIEGRLTPDFLSLAVALGAGAAGALSLSSGVSAALVGVMIAAALIPPVAAVGIGVAWELPQVIVSAGLLVVVNALGVNLATLVVFWLQNYRPSNLLRLRDARGDALRRGAALLVALGLVSAVLVGITFSSFQSSTSEERINDEVVATLDQEQYGNLTLISVEVEREGDLVGRTVGEILLTGQSPRTIERVVVIVGRPGFVDYPRLAERLDDRIEAIVGDEVVTEVRFVETQRG